jgi:hypothetical protein
MALCAAPDSGPVGEGFQIVAIFPGQLEKFVDVHVGGFFAEESFKAPLNVGAVPRLQTIAARGQPVEFEDVPHRCEQWL